MVVEAILDVFTIQSVCAYDLKADARRSLARPVENVSISFPLVGSSWPLCEFFSLHSSFLIKDDFSNLLSLQETSGGITDGRGCPSCRTHACGVHHEYGTRGSHRRAGVRAHFSSQLVEVLICIPRTER